MSQQIDLHKLMTWIKETESKFTASASDFNHGIVWAMRQVKAHILAFQPDPQPILAPGDKVRHHDYTDYGIGEMFKMSKSGKRAKVKFSTKYGYFFGYYRLDKLEKVEGTTE